MGMYGEGDNTVITPAVLRAKQDKSITAIGYWCKPGENDQQMLYVGNSAWAHLCAVKALRERPDQCGGEVYFLTDDTPRGTFRAMCTPIINAVGLHYSDRVIPSGILLPIVYVIEFILTLISPIYKYSLPFTSNTLYLLNAQATFSRQKLETNVNYSPLFSYSEAMKRSCQFYKRFVKP